MTRHRRVAAVLGVLAAAFAARVAGQAVVAFGDEPWVAALTSGGWPPMGAWYSGLIPYSALLPIQGVILAAQAWHARRDPLRCYGHSSPLPMIAFLVMEDHDATTTRAHG